MGNEWTGQALFDLVFAADAVAVEAFEEMETVQLLRAIVRGATENEWAADVEERARPRRKSRMLNVIDTQALKKKRHALVTRDTHYVDGGDGGGGAGGGRDGLRGGRGTASGTADAAAMAAGNIDGQLAMMKRQHDHARQQHGQQQQQEDSGARRA